MIDTARFGTQFIQQLSNYISCTLHDDRLNQLRDSLYLIRCRTSALCVAKFLVLTAERTLLIANFRRGVENTTKFPLLFKRITARNASIFPSKFRAIFRWKFAKTKNEIRAFHLHYFCTVLYVPHLHNLRDLNPAPRRVCWIHRPNIQGFLALYSAY